ncbi:MAG: hypothetical protein HJJLKODD_01127 [Phycisphaerae bacterium]|nr:hypothetical protein [Phycisphaerae bacterium]
MEFERELLKGVLPMAVLKLLRRRNMYGYELVQELSRQTDGVLELGQSTVYPLLYNLEAQGLVEGVWQAAQNGRDRKYYQLTDKGAKRLERDLVQWGELVRGVGQIITEVISGQSSAIS